MKVFVSVDMEGATGIVHNDQLLPGGFDYGRGRELLTGDVAAAVGAALAMDDVLSVLVCDGHGNMRNLLIERLPANCEVVVGPASSKTLCQSEGLDASFGAVMLVGYHARAGARDAVLPHTWIGSVVHEVRVNGRVFGEAALTAAIAGEFGVPVVFVSGDEAACREAKADLGDDLVTVAVKRATGPKAAVCRTPAATSQDIRLGALQGLEAVKRRKPFRVPGPVEFRIAFHQVAQADRAAKRPGVERAGDREVSFTRPTYLEAVREAWQTAEWTAGEHPEWLK
jgi:D-amino peptidase